MNEFKNTFNKIIKLWDLFIDEWRKDEKNSATSYLTKDKSFYKPSFYDFMEWLSKNNK